MKELIKYVSQRRIRSAVLSVLSKRNKTHFFIVRSDIASLNDETAKAIKKLNDASKLLRKVRDDLNLQNSQILNLTSLLHKGDEELKKDFDNLRRHELSSPLVREAFIAGT